MPNATITVSWNSTTGLTAAPTTITANPNSNVEVTWAIGTGVQSITNITTPSNASGSLNTPTQTGTVWSMQDYLGTAGQTYNYTISITNSNFEAVHHDPEIVNDPQT